MEEQTQHTQKSLGEKAINYFIIFIIGFAVLALLFTATRFLFPPTGAVSAGTSQASDHFGSGGFTEYDLFLAKKLMDKDGDGICDVCGMSIDFCIESGQLQCNMGEKTGNLSIGVLDKTKQTHHYHADFKVFINGNPINFNNPTYFVKSRFMHVENDVQGDSGEVLHMHASGVPLWLFFESIGMKFDNQCFALDTGEKYCNNSNNSLKFYVNGNPNKEFGDYVFEDNDKILVSYGPTNEDLAGQLAAVTSFSQKH